MNNDEKITVDEEQRKDYDDLLFQYHKSMDKIRELEEIVNSLLYALRKTNNERLVNEDESLHYQEMYAEEHRRANKLFDIVEKLDAPLEVLKYFKKYFHFELIFENNQTYLVFKSKERYLPIDDKLSVANKYYELLKEWLENDK